MSRRVWCLVVPGAVAVLAGCGAKTIDPARVERFLHGALSPPPRALHCPVGVPVERGHAFTCTARSPTGQRYVVRVHIADGNGRVRVGPSDVRPG